MVITSLNHPNELNSHTGKGWDFTIGIGTRWGEVVKKLKYSKTIKKIIEKVEKAEEAANNPITKYALKLSFSDWMDIKDRIIELVKASGMKPDDSNPNMEAFGIPSPFSALEISGTWGFEQYRVESVSSAITY